MNSPGVAAVDRALRILAAFTEDRPILTLAELARATGFYKSTILRLCVSLLDGGHLVRLRDGAFCLGPEALRLGMVYKKSFRMAEVVIEKLEGLVAAFGETASYHVRDGAERICVNRIESPLPVADTMREGMRRPLTQGASGHVFLAFSGEDGERFARIRRSLVAVTRGEDDGETAEVASPVFAPLLPEAIGAIAVSGPANRFSEARVAAMTVAVRRAAKDLTRALGGSARPFDPAP